MGKPSKRFTRTRSKAAFKAALNCFPGGVNSPVRSWKSVGLNDEGPFFVQDAKGAEIVDIDGNRYVDLVGSWGPMILGHAHSKVVSAIKKQAEKGASYGCPTQIETRLAELVKKLMPNIQKLRFVSSGSEAVMHALRVARGFTKRDKIVKFEGNYHGASDALLVKAGSGAATFGVPDSAGVPKSVAEHTLTVPYNNLEAVATLMEQHGNDVAAIVVEPVVGNSGVLPPELGFLEGLRKLCDQYQSLLIFDEVMTGFRLSIAGAQGRFGLIPDLTTLGKIVGGGLPCAAYGGRADVMDVVAPVGDVYQAGTLSGNPLAMAAGLATLKQLQEPEVYEQLEVLGQEVEDILGAAAQASGWNTRIRINRVGSMLTVFFAPGPIKNFADAASSNTETYGRFFKSMLERGVYFPPSQFEAAFMNLSMKAKHLKRIDKAAKETFAKL